MVRGHCWIVSVILWWHYYIQIFLGAGIPALVPSHLEMLALLISFMQVGFFLFLSIYIFVLSFCLILFPSPFPFPFLGGVTVENAG